MPDAPQGVLTAERIWQAFANFNASNGSGPAAARVAQRGRYLVRGTLPDVLAEYVATQTEWIVNGAHPANESAYWTHAALLLTQGAAKARTVQLTGAATGVYEGYAAVAPANQTLTQQQVYILVMAGTWAARMMILTTRRRPGGPVRRHSVPAQHISH